MTVPAFKGVTSVKDGGPSISASRPTSTEGDVIVAALRAGAMASDADPPSSPGWTLLRTLLGNSLHIFYRPVGAGEAGSYTFTLDSAADPFDQWPNLLILASYAGPFSTPPQIVVAEGARSRTLPGLTTPADDARLIGVVPYGASGYAIEDLVVTGMDRRAQEYAYLTAAGQATWYALGLVDEEVPASGPTGDRRLRTPYLTFGSVVLALVPGESIPYAPTLVAPESGALVDFGTSEGRTFTWQHTAPQVGDVQTAWSFCRGGTEWWDADSEEWDDTEVWNTGTDQSYAFPAGSWVNGFAYTWAVATSNAVGEGPMSSARAVEGNTAPVLTIDGPTGDITDTTRPLISLGYSDGEGDAKDAHRLYVHTLAASQEDGFDPEITTPVWDSKVRLTDALADQVGVDLANDTDYVTYGRARQAGNLWSALAGPVGFGVDLIPTPAPTLAAVWNTAAARVDLTVTPADEDPATDRVTVQRSLDGLTWETAPTLGDVDATGPVSLADRFAPFNSEVQYRAVAHRDVGDTAVITSEPSAVVTVTTTARSGWLRSLDDPTLDTAVSVARGFSERMPRPSETFYPTGQDRAVVIRRARYGSQIDALGIYVFSRQDREAVEAILDSAGTLLLQDVLGLQWWIEVAGDMTRTRITAAPTSVEAATGKPVRDAHTLTVPVVEVQAP